MADDYWQEYLEKLRQVEQAAKLAAFWTEETAKAALLVAFWAEETAEAVRKVIDHASTRS